jgi:hypothetical protein
MRTRTLLAVGYVGITFMSLWLRSVVPVFVIATSHDDFLFVKLAYYLGAGRWLGAFDNLTLAKGMGYPIFILTSFLAGVPLKLAEHAAYLAAAGIAAWLVQRLTTYRWLAFTLFALLAFNPVLWHPQLARVIREGLYISLSFAVIMLAACAAARKQSPTPAIRGLLLIALGLVGALYWLTREEGVWLAPALALLLAAAAIRAWRERKHIGSASTLAAVRTGAACTLVLAVFAMPVCTVYAMNYWHYGAAILTEFQSLSFQAGYGALARIRHQNWQRYVVFPKDVREQAYAVSAAASELRPALDGATGETWRERGCVQTGINPCPEILGGWFMWALRDAVAQAGHYTSAQEALTFYDRIAVEINGACRDGRLTCEAAGVSIFPPWRTHYFVDALARGPALMRLLTGFGRCEYDNPGKLRHG